MPRIVHVPVCKKDPRPLATVAAGYFLFSLDEAVELKAQKDHCVRPFRGLSEAIIGECQTVERVGDVEDPPWCPPLRRRRSLSSAGQSTPVAWVKNPLLWTVAVLRTFCVDHGLERFLYWFFLSFSLSLHAPMCLSVFALL